LDLDSAGSCIIVTWSSAFLCASVRNSVWVRVVVVRLGLRMVAPSGRVLVSVLVCVRVFMTGGADWWSGRFWFGLCCCRFDVVVAKNDLRLHIVLVMCV